jgi:hypothetical protein
MRQADLTRTCNMALTNVDFLTRYGYASKR